MAKVRIKKKIIALALAVSMVATLGYTTPVQATELDDMTISANDVVDEEVVENQEVAETTGETEIVEDVELNEEATLLEIKNSPVLTLNAVRAGDVLESTSDENWYQFTITERGYFSVNVSLNDSADPNDVGWGWDMTIYKGLDDMDSPIKVSRKIKSNYTCPIMSMGTGTYYIKIEDDYSNEAPIDVPYDIKVNYVKGAEWEQEYNDSNVTANKINVNKTYKGGLFSSSDADWYTFTTTQNGYFEIAFGANDFTDINAMGWGWDVDIYDASMNLIRSYDKVKTSKIQSTLSSDKLPYRAGTYYIKISPNYSNSAPVDCYYDLKVNFTATNAWEAEGNNDNTVANTFAPSGKISGLLYKNNEQDWYCVSIKERGKLNLDFLVDGSVKEDAIGWGWRVYIYNSALDELEVYDDIKSNLDMEALSVNPGKYYIKVVAEYSNSAPTACIYHIQSNFVKATPRTDIEDFVSRMYTVALNRDAEAAGLKDWSNKLENKSIDGAGIASGFINSAEFTNRRLSNSKYVDTLYQTFFNREPDAGGRSNWISFLNKGGSRNEVLAGFVNSQEFSNLCDNYGIARGTLQANGSSIYKPGVRDYVLRMYTVALNRNGETVGVEDWTNRINTGSMSAEEVAKSFFSSQEFLNRNLSNEDYVETLYETFMGRSSDAAGKADWVGRLNAGTSRQQVLEGFSRSAEFGNILRSYGL